MSSRISIPSGAWMCYRKSGRYLYAQKLPPIIWTTQRPPKGSVVHMVAWANGQVPLQASGVYVQQ